MAESLDAYAEIAAIRDELEEHGHLLDALLRAQPLLSGQIYEDVASDPVLAEIMLRVDGTTSQGDIGQAIRAMGAKGASTGSISGKFDKLAKDLSVITLVHQRAGKVYRPTRLASVIGLTRRLERDTKRPRL
jgi:hypothetical protein